MARHVAEHGFGTPDAGYVLYALRIGLYVVGGMLFALSTPGVDGFTHLSTWWSEPVVFYEVVLWTMLFEVLGRGEVDVRAMLDHQPWETIPVRVLSRRTG